ncbi:MAG: 50S ribosomal protein L18 [Saprospiraceae bacterium]|nr:50S ribosomal protein L18 [Saprospiraceae bacterium]
MSNQKIKRRRTIRYRIRNKISGTDVRPRMSVYRSNKGIYCQLINDLKGETLAQANSLEKSIDTKLNKTEQAKQVGKLIAERCKSLNIDNVVFDRGGYLYHGRVKALADAAREGGLSF